jgi:hypothetical protein
VRAAGLIETRPAWAYEIEITDIREIIANSPKTPLRTFTEGSFTLPTTGSQAHPCFTMNRTATASRNSRHRNKPGALQVFGAAGAGPSYPAASVSPAPCDSRGEGFFCESASREDYALTVPPPTPRSRSSSRVAGASR